MSLRKMLYLNLRRTKKDTFSSSFFHRLSYIIKLNLNGAQKVMADSVTADGRPC